VDAQQLGFVAGGQWAQRDGHAGMLPDPRAAGYR
jgi:hypothetical protein